MSFFLVCVSKVKETLVGSVVLTKKRIVIADVIEAKCKLIFRNYENYFIIAFITSVGMCPLARYTRCFRPCVWCL